MNAGNSLSRKSLMTVLSEQYMTHMSGKREGGKISQFKLTLGKPEETACKQDMTRIRHQFQRKNCCIASTFSIVGSSQYNAMVLIMIMHVLLRHSPVLVSVFSHFVAGGRRMTLPGLLLQGPCGCYILCSFWLWWVIRVSGGRARWLDSLCS
jgi:hypothetical protein